MSRIRTESIAIAALAALCSAGLAIIHWPLVRHPGDLVFFGIGDCWMYYGPTSFFVDQSIHSGTFPLWNPLILSGQPIAGNPQYLLFYPPNLLRSLLTFNPSPWRTHIGLAILQYLHVMSAAVGTYALGRRLTLSRSAAVAAGLLFVFSAAFSQRIYGHMYIVYTASWMPWALFALHSMMSAPTSRAHRQSTLALAIAFALAILAGTPQITLLIAFALVSFWIALRAHDAWTTFGSRSKQRLLFSNVGSDLAGGVAAVAIAALLAVALLGPSFQLNLHTLRGNAAGEVTFEALSADPGWRLFELLAVYIGTTNFEGIRTLTASGLILVSIALIGARRREVFSLVCVSALFIAGSVEQSPVHRLFVWLAPFPYGASARAMIIAMLPLALLAGMGMDLIRSAEITPRLRAIATLLASVAAVAFCAIIARRLDDTWIHLSYGVLFFPAATAAVAIASLWSMRARACVVILPLILVAEPVLWRSTAMKQLVDLKTPFVSMPEAIAKSKQTMWQGNSRGSSTSPNTPLYRLEPEINGYDPLYLEGVSKLIYPNLKSTTFRRGADAYSMAKTTKLTYLLLKRAFWLQNQYAPGEVPEAARNFPPTTTAYLADADGLSVPQIDPAKVPDLVYSNSIGRVVVSARPKTFTPASHPTAKDPLVWENKIAAPPQHKTLALYVKSDCPATFVIITRENNEDTENRVVAIFSTASTGGELARFDVPMPDIERMVVGLTMNFSTPEGSVTLERVELLVDQADETQHITHLHRTANTASAELIDLPGPRILSYIDFAYPGWRAYVDGKRVPILRAFSYFKAVEVPAGTHRVDFVYRPTLVYIAMAVSTVSWIACAALLVWTAQPSKQPEIQPRNRKSRRKGKGSA